MHRSFLIRFFPIFCITGALFIFRCAYLNCFYNARVAFDKTYTAHMKLKHEGADTTDELPQDIKTGYDRAIKKCTKLIDVYPKRKKWHDDVTYLKSKATYYKREYSIAIRCLRQYQQEYPKSPFIPESYLYLGKAYLGDENLQKAEEAFELILKNYPYLNKDEEITLLLAEIAIRREGKSQAVHILEESLRNIKSVEKRMGIILQLSALYIDLKLYDKAVKVLKSAPHNKEYQHYLFQIEFYLLICYSELDNYTEAVDLADKMLKNKQYLKYASKILLQKGIILKIMGRLTDAIKVLVDITKGTGPADIQGKAWYELALIYQHEFSDFEKAKECFIQVQSFSTDKELLAIADERIQGIDLKNQYQSEIDSKSDKRKKKVSDESEDINVTNYKIAEVYWINLSEADSALNYFTIITADTLADSAILMKSLYARAWILRFIKQDTATSDSLYNGIIAKYPATIVAKKSQQDRGVTVTVKTRGDSANLAFIEAERLCFNDKNPVAAVNQYYKVAKKYADQKDIASNSIYAAAWVCDNVLNKNKKAFMLYKKLCDDFPQSDLCINEAKPRIKIVEDTLKVLEAQKKQNGAEKRPQKKKKPLKKISAQDTLAASKEEDILIPGVVDSSSEDVPEELTIDTASQNIGNLKLKETELNINIKEDE